MYRFPALQCCNETITVLLYDEAPTSRDGRPPALALNRLDSTVMDGELYRLFRFTHEAEVDLSSRELLIVKQSIEFQRPMWTRITVAVLPWDSLL